MFVDSHCHLNYLHEPEAAWARARAAGVESCLCIGVDQQNIAKVLELAEHEVGVWASVGEHPGACSGDASWVRDHLGHARVVAVGEMGLDYLGDADEATCAQQRRTFAEQLSIAADAGLPVIVHTREAEEDTLAALQAQPGVVGVLHCYTGSWELAEAAIELGYYVSISGIVTFKNATNVRDVLVRVPSDRLLIETDAPWLAPVPHRGETNEPSYVAATARFIAEFLDEDLDHLAKRTRANFYSLFQRATP